jgi:hypothetical protein
MEDEQSEFLPFGEPLHYIQRDILAELKSCRNVHYSDLKPSDLDGHAFNYHLKSLIEKKLVLKNSENLYRLSSTGRYYSDFISITKNRIKLRPVGGAFLVILSPNGLEVLSYRASEEPLLGYSGLPFVRMRMGQSHSDLLAGFCARRDLELVAKDFKLAGFLNARYYIKDSGSLVAHRSGPIYLAKLKNLESDPAKINAKLSWQDLENIVNGSEFEIISGLNVGSPSLLDLKITTE